MVSRTLVESQAYIHEQHELVNRFVSKVFPGYPVSFEGKIIHYNATLCPDYPFHVSPPASSIPELANVGSKIQLSAMSAGEV